MLSKIQNRINLFNKGRLSLGGEYRDGVKLTNKKTDEETKDRQTNRQPDRQTNRQSDK